MFSGGDYWVLVKPSDDVVPDCAPLPGSPVTLLCRKDTTTCRCGTTAKSS